MESIPVLCSRATTQPFPQPGGGDGKGRDIKTPSSNGYLSVHGVKVDVGLLGPLLPELRVVQGDVVAVLRGHEAGL